MSTYDKTRDIGDARVPDPLLYDGMSPADPVDLTTLSGVGTIPPRNNNRREADFVPSAPGNAPDFVPSAPEFIQQERKRALQTVREATPKEIACIFSAGVRLTIIRTQMGRVPQSESSWFALQTAASFLDSPPTDQGKAARADRRRLIAAIQDVYKRKTAAPVAPSADPVDWVTQGMADDAYDCDPRRVLDDDDYVMTLPCPPGTSWHQWGMFNAETRRTTLAVFLSEWTPPVPLPPVEPTEPAGPDPVVVAAHERHLVQHAWICHHLGYRESPIPDPVEPEEIIEGESGPRHGAASKDASEAMRITLKTCEKAKERVALGKATMHAPWLEDTGLMLRDLIASIGERPTQKTTRDNGTWYYEYSLDCWPVLHHYALGNLAWADKTTQREHQARMRTPTGG